MTGPPGLPEEVRTERLILRPLGLADVDDVLAYRADPETCRYLPYGPRTREQVAADLATRGAPLRLAEDGDRAYYGLREDPEGPVRGELVLMLRRPAMRHYEVGWVLSPQATGRGYATEAAAAGLGLLFDHLGAHRVHAQMDPANVASARVCHRLGMRQEAHFRRDFLYEATGEWSETVVWALLEEEWAARAAG